MGTNGHRSPSPKARPGIYTIRYSRLEHGKEEEKQDPSGVGMGQLASSCCSVTIRGSAAGRPAGGSWVGPRAENGRAALPTADCGCLRFRRGEIGECVGVVATVGWLVGSRQLHGSGKAWRSGISAASRGGSRAGASPSGGPRCVGEGRDLDSSWSRRRGRGREHVRARVRPRWPFPVRESGCDVGSRDKHIWKFSY